MLAIMEQLGLLNDLFGYIIGHVQNPHNFAIFHDGRQDHVPIRFDTTTLEMKSIHLQGFPCQDPLK